MEEVTCLILHAPAGVGSMDPWSWPTAVTIRMVVWYQLMVSNSDPYKVSGVLSLLGSSTVETVQHLLKEQYISLNNECAVMNAP